MIYDYRCLSKGCEKPFQADVPMKDRDRVRCPACRSRKVKRVLHRVNIVFKGTGFYSTDKGK
jgi:putative FmdB family regulatory protein